MTARTAAIHYVVDGFSMNRADVKGRHAAGVGFVGGFARYMPAGPVYCYAPSREAAKHCADAMAAAAGRPRMVKHIPFGKEAALAEAGCLFTSGPGLGEYAWRRRFVGQRGYSLCGLTHTICSDRVLDSFGDFMTAPLQPWDALVCTSQPARAAIENLLDQWADYLEQRIGTRPKSALRLPVIPLGVDCRRFADGPQRAGQRAEFRRRFGIADDDIALLFFGRLSFHAKAHPVAMLQAAETAAKATGRQLHFLFAGRFPHPGLGRMFEQAARSFAPSVRYHVVDGTDDALCDAVWFAADLFMSLSDNIQETFGLTPIEAQAAGLPAIVSDWDGYKDTVADGETGFRIPTAIPPLGPGEDLAGLYLAEGVTFDRYIGAASLCTAVDTRRCAEVLTRLVEDAELRGRMSEQARRRARETYDWSVVIGQYAELWGELGDIRAHAEEVAPLRPGSPPAPLRDDPFRTFGNFASRRLTDDVRLVADVSCGPLAQALGNEMNTYMAQLLLSEAALQQIVADLQRRPATAAELCRAHGDPRQVWRSIMWLLKLGVIREADQ